MTARTCGALINSNSRAVMDVAAPCCSAAPAPRSGELPPLLLQPGPGTEQGERGGNEERREREGGEG